MTSRQARQVVENYLTRQGWARKDGGKNTYFEKGKKRYRLTRTTIKPQVYIQGLGWSSAIRPAMGLIQVAQNLIAKGLVAPDANMSEEV